MIKSRFVLFVIVLCLLISCKTKVLVQRSAIKPLRTKRILDSLDKYALNYNYLTTRFSGNYKSNDEDQSLKGILKIKRDSIIWMSIIPALGIEAARIFMTPDSIKMLNRLNSTYLATNFDQIDSLFHLNLDFFTIQSILTNQVFEYPYAIDEDNLKTYHSRVDSFFYVLHSMRERRLNAKVRKNKVDRVLYQQITVDPLYYRIVASTVKDFELRREIELNYANFKQFEDGIYPREISVSFHRPEQFVRIELETTKMMIDADSTFSFRIPEKYKLMEFKHK
jgi:hypothetical protein